MDPSTIPSSEAINKFLRDDGMKLQRYVDSIVSKASVPPSDIYGGMQYKSGAYLVENFKGVRNNAAAFRTRATAQQAIKRAVRPFGGAGWKVQKIQDAAFKGRSKDCPTVYTVVGADGSVLLEAAYSRLYENARYDKPEHFLTDPKEGDIAIVINKPAYEPSIGDSLQKVHVMKVTEPAIPRGRALAVIYFAKKGPAKIAKRELDAGTNSYEQATPMADVFSPYDLIGERAWKVLSRYLGNDVPFDATVWVRGPGIENQMLPNEGGGIQIDAKKIKVTQDERKFLRGVADRLLKLLAGYEHRVEQLDAVNKTLDAQSNIATYTSLANRLGPIKDEPVWEALETRRKVSLLESLSDKGLLTTFSSATWDKNYMCSLTPAAVDLLDVFIPPPPDLLPDDMRQTDDAIANKAVYTATLQAIGQTVSKNLLQLLSVLEWRPLSKARTSTGVEYPNKLSFKVHATTWIIDVTDAVNNATKWAMPKAVSSAVTTNTDNVLAGARAGATQAADAYVTKKSFESMNLTRFDPVFARLVASPTSATYEVEDVTLPNSYAGKPDRIAVTVSVVVDLTAVDRS